MRLDTFRRLSGDARDAGVLFWFHGDFRDRELAGLGIALQQRLEDRGVPRKLRPRLFNAFVELAQNVLHYAWPTAEESVSPGSRPGEIALGESGDGWWVACANPIRQEHAARVTGRLGAIQAMSPQEIHAALRAQLDREEHEATDDVSRGAGLGLLTIARAAAAPLEWSLESRADGALWLYVCARFAAGSAASAARAAPGEEKP
jgi:hypothetical protein